MALFGCVMCICSTAGVQWRMWHVDNIMGGSRPGLAGIGLWVACSAHRVSIKKINVLCTALADDESLPSEIVIAQDFMPLASIVNAVTVF